MVPTLLDCKVVALIPLRKPSFCRSTRRHTPPASSCRRGCRHPRESRSRQNCTPGARTEPRTVQRCTCERSEQEGKFSLGRPMQPSACATEHACNRARVQPSTRATEHVCNRARVEPRRPRGGFGGSPPDNPLACPLLPQKSTLFALALRSRAPLPAPNATRCCCRWFFRALLCARFARTYSTTHGLPPPSSAITPTFSPASFFHSTLFPASAPSRSSRR